MFLSIVPLFPPSRKVRESRKRGAKMLGPPEGPIWQLIEQCYSLYRQDLDRFHPSPIRWLKTPATFYYYQRQTAPKTSEPPDPEHELYWRDGNLIIHRAYIGPKEEQTDILLPLLARLLYDCNTPSLLVERLFHLAHVAEQSWLTAWPLTVLLYISQECKQQWKAMEREQILERDWFANALGPGPTSYSCSGKQSLPSSYFLKNITASDNLNKKVFMRE